MSYEHDPSLLTSVVAERDEADKRLKSLCEEVRRIMTTLTNDPATLEMLQEALDTYGPPDRV